MALALLIAYAVVVFVVWAWRLTVDISRGDAARLAGLVLLATGIGSLAIGGGRLHSAHAALIIFGTLYTCMLLASLGRPARMINYGGVPAVATPKQFWRIQWAFVSLLLPAAVAISVFAHHF